MKERLMTIAVSISTSFGLMKVGSGPIKQLEVDRLIVRDELIVSDTGQAWEEGFEEEQIARGIYARSLRRGAAGLWVRGRLIKTEIDDPFDDRFHAIQRDRSLCRAPGHISWNVWLEGAWRQMAIIQGEGLEPSEVPPERWNGVTHPGRLRFQTFRPGHGEPLTDALIGQGKMSLGGGGYGGEGLPYPSRTLQIWGGSIEQRQLNSPAAPRVLRSMGPADRRYALIAVNAEGDRSPISPWTTAGGVATLQWDSVPGAEAYIVVRDGKPMTEPLRIEGRMKQWTTPPSP